MELVLDHKDGGANRGVVVGSALRYYRCGRADASINTNRVGHGALAGIDEGSGLRRSRQWVEVPVDVCDRACGFGKQPGQVRE